MKKKYLNDKANLSFGIALGTLISITSLGALPGEIISKTRFRLAAGNGLLFAAISVVLWIFSRKTKS